MSRTIDSGSDRKRRRHLAARSIAIVCCNGAAMSQSICRQISSLVALRSLAHRVVDFHAVLGGVNALRSASTVRSARPAGVDAAGAPLEVGKYAMVEVRIAVDSTRSEAYVRNISLVPHGTPSTSPDVERFGTTLQGFVPTAFLIHQKIRSRRLSRPAITAPNTPSALDAQYSAFGAALRCRPFIVITNAANRESTINTGRRIMAERRRKRHKRVRRVPPIVRRAATATIDAPGDEALRAVVRILARQAAREAFESELRRNAAIVH